MFPSKWIIATATVALVGPMSAFAAEADVEVSEEDLMNVIEESVPAMMDGRGGGGSYSIYPPFGGGVNVDASITKEVTPDFVGLNAYCDSGRKDTREEAKMEVTRMFNEIKAGVGTDGRVRRTGTIAAYPYYGQAGEETGYTANLSVFVRIVNVSAAQRISDLVEEKGCGVNWDVRLVDTQAFELDVLDDLTDRLNKRKAVFEKLLGKRLNTIVSASLSTWADGYSSYDPETNKVDATTTLNVSFDLGSRATITPASSARPRG